VNSTTPARITSFDSRSRHHIELLDNVVQQRFATGQSKVSKIHGVGIRVIYLRILQTVNVSFEAST
jgi:hypothetical protein